MITEEWRVVDMKAKQCSLIGILAMSAVGCIYSPTPSLVAGTGAMQIGTNTWFLAMTWNPTLINRFFWRLESSDNLGLSRF